MKGAGQARVTARQHRVLLFLLAVSLVAKLGIAAAASREPERFVGGDSASYLRTAAALVETGRFASSPDDPTRPETLRTPGYPAFLALVQALVGPRRVAMIAAQVVVSTVTMWLVFVLARDCGGARSGLLALLLLALDVTSFAFSLLLLTETLFTCLLTVAWFVAIRMVERRMPMAWVAAFGSTLGLSVLVRPITYYLVVPACAWFLWSSRQRSLPWQRTIASAVLLLVTWSVPVAGWKLRNWLHTGEPILSRIEGVNMLFYRGAAIVSLRDGIGMQEARESLGQGRYEELHPDAAGLSPEALAERWSDEGRSLILAHPVLFARIQIRGTGSILLGLGHHYLMPVLGLPKPSEGPMGDLLRLSAGAYVGRWLAERPGQLLAFVAEEGHLLILYLGAGAWWICALRRRRLDPSDAWPWLVFCYLLLISAGPEANARFRVPLAPTLAVYGALGLQLTLRSRGVSTIASRLLGRRARWLGGVSTGDDMLRPPDRTAEFRGFLQDPRPHPRPRWLQGYPAQEPGAPRRQAAARLDHRAG